MPEPGLHGEPDASSLNPFRLSLRCKMRPFSIGYDTFSQHNK